MRARRLSATVLAAAMTVVVSLGGCGGINANETVAVLNGENIPLGIVNFAAQRQAADYDSYLVSYYGANMWNEDYGDGATMADDVRKEVVENIKNQHLLEDHMADYQVELTEDELSAIGAAADSFMAENDKKALNTMGATRDIVVEYLRLKTIENKMSSAIKATADTEVSDDEAAQRTFSYYEVYLPDEDEEDTGEDTEEEADAADNAALKALAEEVAEAAKTDFDSVEAEYSQTLSTYSYGDDDELFAKEVLEVADELTEGEVSDLITTSDNAYYVIRLDSEFDRDATDAKKEAIVNTRQNDLYDEKVQEYSDAATWEVKDDVLSKINFDTMYELYDETSEDAQG